MYLLFSNCNNIEYFFIAWKTRMFLSHNSALSELSENSVLKEYYVSLISCSESIVDLLILIFCGQHSFWIFLTEYFFSLFRTSRYLLFFKWFSRQHSILVAFFDQNVLKSWRNTRVIRCVHAWKHAWNNDLQPEWMIRGKELQRKRLTEV